MLHRSCGRTLLRAASALAFLTLFAGSAGAAGKPGASAMPATTATTVTSPVKAVHVRQEIHQLTAAQIAAFRKGVAVMQSRKANDPASWLYQANIHGYPSDSSICPLTPGPKQTAWATCQHGNFFFLAWHRMYLYYLERMLRQASGDPSFTLPYWNYENPEHRDLPEPMRVPADGSNPLYVAQRAPNCNLVKPGQPCVTAEDAADDEAMRLLPFCNCPAGKSCAGCASGLLPDEAFGSQLTPVALHSGGNYGQLESQPHNVIHDAVGGSVGWMSFVECAARDPIFWLHHANIDRLWQVWLNQGGGRADPLGAGDWKNHLFTFFDVRADGTSKKVAMTGCQVLDMATQLDYEYSGMPVQNVKLCTEKAPFVTAAAPPARKLLA
ncbi:MAG TPA: tyrosinase family protein, partial [Thermoanaerobaculia bacterium]|nr:tyrosinase family protein [Thermoanaerobaculia bacterium]